MTRKPIQRQKVQRPHIPEEQMDLPISFDPVGRMVTLRELMASPPSFMLSFTSLSPEKRAELTAKRISAQPRFEVAMIGTGLLDKERAIKEVMAQTATGRILVEIEQRLVQNLLETIANK